MGNSSREKEIQFHIDRVQESTTRLIQSVLQDPRLSMEEQITLLTQVSGAHVEVVEIIHSAIESGCYRAIQEAR